MASTARPAQSDFSAELLVIDRPSLLRRVLRVLARFLIAVCIGVAGTLAWQSYGEAAKQKIASWATQHGWSPAWLSYGEAAKTNPPPGPEIAAEPAAPSPDQQQLKAIAFSLTAVQRRVEQLAAGQEQLVVGQEQTASDIAKLQAAEQDIRHKISAAPPRPAAAPASKPMSSPPPRAPTPLR